MREKWPVLLIMDISVCAHQMCIVQTKSSDTFYIYWEHCHDLYGLLFRQHPLSSSCIMWDTGVWRVRTVRTFLHAGQSPLSSVLILCQQNRQICTKGGEGGRGRREGQEGGGREGKEVGEGGRGKEGGAGEGQEGGDGRKHTHD